MCLAIQPDTTPPGVMLSRSALVGLQLSLVFARPLEEFRFPTFESGTHNDVYCNETDDLEKGGKASITFMNRYRKFYGCQPKEYQDLDLDGFPDESESVRLGVHPEDIRVRTWPVQLPGNTTMFDGPAQGQETPVVDGAGVPGGAGAGELPGHRHPGPDHHRRVPPGPPMYPLGHLRERGEWAPEIPAASSWAFLRDTAFDQFSGRSPSYTAAARIILANQSRENGYQYDEPASFKEALTTFLYHSLGLSKEPAETQRSSTDTKIMWSNSLRFIQRQTERLLQNRQLKAISEQLAASHFNTVYAMYLSFAASTVLIAWFLLRSLYDWLTERCIYRRLKALNVSETQQAEVRRALVDAVGEQGVQLRQVLSKDLDRSVARMNNRTADPPMGIFKNAATAYH